MNAIPTPEEIMQVHQYLYYVKARPVWTDYRYDQFCRENRLQGGGGSDRAEDYAPEIQSIGDLLLLCR